MLRLLSSGLRWLTARKDKRKDIEPSKPRASSTPTNTNKAGAGAGAEFGFGYSSSPDDDELYRQSQHYLRAVTETKPKVYSKELILEMYRLCCEGGIWEVTAFTQQHDLEIFTATDPNGEFISTLEAAMLSGNSGVANHILHCLYNTEKGRSTLGLTDINDKEGLYLLLKEIVMQPVPFETLIDTLIYDYNLDVKVIFSDGTNLLHLCTNADTAKHLILHEIDPTALNSHGRTPSEEHAVKLSKINLTINEVESGSRTDLSAEQLEVLRTCRAEEQKIIKVLQLAVLQQIEAKAWASSTRLPQPTPTAAAGFRKYTSLGSYEKLLEASMEEDCDVDSYLTASKSSSEESPAISKEKVARTLFRRRK